MLPPPPRSTLFPYTTPLPISEPAAAEIAAVPAPRAAAPAPPMPPTDALARLKDRVAKALFERMGARMNDPGLGEDQDRKSTRLNSSHANISYAVFCLKKKKNT